LDYFGIFILGYFGIFILEYLGIFILGYFGIFILDYFGIFILGYVGIFILEYFGIFIWDILEYVSEEFCIYPKSSYPRIWNLAICRGNIVGIFWDMFGPIFGSLTPC